MKVQETGKNDPDTTALGPRLVLFGVALASGFVVTGIEITLGRLLSPHFGSSLTVWASIMASVIGALALGYPLGGWLADRRPGAELPVAALLVGGLGGALLGLATPLGLSGAMEGVGLSGPAFWSRLGLVLALFGFPCIALASVPPAVLRATLRGRETAGRDSGLLYALGSLGSVLGILLPALWWIPTLGVRATFLILAAAAVLPVVAAVAFRVVHVGGRQIAASAVGLFALPALLNVIGVPAPANAEQHQILYDRDSGTQRIRVLADDIRGYKRRWLQLDEGWSTHSAYFEPDLVTGQVWDWMALTTLAPQPEDGTTDVLIIGLAGGTVSNIVTKHLKPLMPGLAITGVELDSAVIEVADRYLGLDRSHLETVAADGRVWLRGSGREFDVIILDAYRQPSIPAHLSTREFFEEVQQHLAPGGVAVLNVFGPAGESRLLDGLSKTWASVFPAAQHFSGPAAGAFASQLLFSSSIIPMRHIASHTIPRPLKPAWKQLRDLTRPLMSRDEVVAWSDDLAPVELITDESFRSLRPL